MEMTTGTVEVVKDGIATVSVDTAVTCSRCAAGKGCGAGVSLQAAQNRVLSVSVPRGADLKRGDTVTLSISPGHLLRAAWYGYGMPLLGLVTAVGASWTTGLADTDLAAAGWAAAGLAAGALGGRRLAGTTCASARFTPRLEGPAR